MSGDGLQVVDQRPMQRTASLSSGGVYRYSLGRFWGDGPTATWIMLNPSTADANVDDPTIRRCIAFTRGWGLDGLNVVNLYALRSTDPKALHGHPDPVGADNEDHILYFLRSAVFAVAAWGAGCAGLPYVDVQAMAKRVACPLVCLGTTKAGHPRHPLYVKGDTTLVPWPDGAS